LFSVVVQGAALEQLAGLEPRRLEGLTAIVRGWIEGRTLPLIEIGAAGQLELSEPASVSGPTSSLHRFEPRPNDRAAADEPPRSRAR
jgi:hypothetical protein